MNTNTAEYIINRALWTATGPESLTKALGALDWPGGGGVTLDDELVIHFGGAEVGCLLTWDGRFLEIDTDNENPIAVQLLQIWEGQ